ncbi:hypothetical protein GCM10017774_13490 [Lentzea cavernae]|uniref:Uncharacterized protein n=1 Tax=Lentzea cavernae TaxID=2020703 RepID=A0ABQ3M3P3_9PSEU|nr:hypothetical protein GCM10017774_13490 [Lentzea cavernae]
MSALSEDRNVEYDRCTKVAGPPSRVAAGSQPMPFTWLLYVKILPGKRTCSGTLM